jgi:hypothetical protein
MLDKQSANMTLNNYLKKTQYVEKKRRILCCYPGLQARFIRTKLKAKNFWPRLYKLKKLYEILKFFQWFRDKHLRKNCWSHISTFCIFYRQKRQKTVQTSY